MCIRDRYYVDEEEAKIVREIFERYASGETVADIIRDLNRRKLTTSLGKPFNKNSVHRILNNRRYIGYYLYKGQETPGGMPRIIEDELFERCLLYTSPPPKMWPPVRCSSRIFLV